VYRGILKRRFSRGARKSKPNTVATRNSQYEGGAIKGIIFFQDQEATPEELSSHNLRGCPKGHETGKLLTSLESVFTAWTMYLGGGKMLYPVYLYQHMLRLTAVFTNHTRLDQALEACAEGRTQALWVELVENN
jgi:hypothetical protein